MALENANFITELVPGNPTGAEKKKEGDDHLRVIKKAIKQSFPKIGGAVNKTHQEINAMPSTKEQVHTLLGFVPFSASGGNINGNVTVTGNLDATGRLSGVSDERTKKDWKPLTGAQLDALAEVLFGTYTDKETGDRRVGVGAQSIQEIVPEAVYELPDGVLLLNPFVTAAFLPVLVRRIHELERRLQKAGIW